MIRIAAVTGTNGKTTTTSMLEAIVAAAGEPSARVTTLGAWVSGELVAEGPTLEAFLRGLERAISAGVRTFALETTSKALAEGFAQRFPASVAVFTNLSRDHLDLHGSAESYLAAKAQLFTTLGAGCTAVFNAGDPASALLEEVTPPAVRRRGYAGRSGAAPECEHLPLELRAERVSVSPEGTRVEISASPLAGALGGALELRVIGEVFAENALAAALAADALGYAPDAIVHGLRGFEGVPGRFELVAHGPEVVVDYAHTPEALARTLDLARSLAPEGGRVAVVFGCGGERDRGKRPEMGRIAAERADLIVVTSDNPRIEDPLVIIDEILAGTREAKPVGSRRIPPDVTTLSDPDRASAIRLAIELADPRRGDIVVIAGKGHERVQWIGAEAVPFSDAEIARGAAAARSGRKAPP
jgi:UDP-N-acetylmuramoyl-L-alanyl-D-glutamate--2,6-diaminopimelate ligase